MSIKNKRKRVQFKITERIRLFKRKMDLLSRLSSDCECDRCIKEILEIDKTLGI
jgi:hypothetical protein